MFYYFSLKYSQIHVIVNLYITLELLINKISCPKKKPTLKMFLIDIDILKTLKSCNTH